MTRSGCSARIRVSARHRGFDGNHQVVLGEIFGRQFSQSFVVLDEKDACIHAAILTADRAVVQPEAARLKSVRQSKRVPPWLRMPLVNFGMLSMMWSKVPVRAWFATLGLGCLGLVAVGMELQHLCAWRRARSVFSSACSISYRLLGLLGFALPAGVCCGRR
jgi:hypothetical protein